MDLATLAAFLVVVAIGTYVQAVTGFAMALVLMALLVAFDVLPIDYAATVSALLTALMSLVFLRGQWRAVAPRLLWPLLVANGPGVLCGLALLAWLGERQMEYVRLVFGVFAVACGLSVVLRPTPRATLAPAWRTGVFGGLAGVFAGLFAVGGPVMAYHAYRQPVALAAVRATLAVIFVFGNTTRTVVVAGTGGLDAGVLLLGLAGLPVVLVFTALGRRFPPPLGDPAMRRVACGLVALIGVFVAGTAVVRLAGA